MTTQNDGKRFCPLCSQLDDHPRHEISGTVNNVSPHMDCCAASGACPDGTCAIVTRNKGRKTGASFQALIADELEESIALLAARPAELVHFTVEDIDSNVHGGLVAGGAPTELGRADR